MNLIHLLEPERSRVAEMIREMNLAKGICLVGTNEEIFNDFVKEHIVEVPNPYINELEDIFAKIKPRNIKHQPSKLERVYNSLRYRSKKRRHKRKKK